MPILVPPEQGPATVGKLLLLCGPGSGRRLQMASWALPPAAQGSLKGNCLSLAQAKDYQSLEEQQHSLQEVLDWQAAARLAQQHFLQEALDWQAVARLAQPAQVKRQPRRRQLQQGLQRRSLFQRTSQAMGVLSSLSARHEPSQASRRCLPPLAFEGAPSAHSRPVPWPPLLAAASAGASKHPPKNSEAVQPVLLVSPRRTALEQEVLAAELP